MMLSVAKQNPSPLGNSDALTLESLLPEGRLQAEPAWLAALRKEHLVRFLEGDHSFGRYSRLKTDWTTLTPAAPQFHVSDGAGVGILPAPGTGPLVRRLADALSEETGEHLPTHLKALATWDHLVLAGWRDGVAVTWPSGSEAAEVPGIVFENPGGLVLEPLLLEVAPRQEATLFLRWTGGGPPAFHISSLMGTVGESASLKVFLLHDCEGLQHHISSQLQLGRDASVELFTAWTAGKWTVARWAADLTQPGAEWRETHLIFTSGKDHLDVDSQVHLASHHTQCDVQVKTVATESSRAVFTGDILMEKEAVQSEAYLADHVLLLYKGARDDSIPGLEIKAADVKASHAASVGQVDEEQLFYLESRGLDPASARHLIVVGFLESLLDRAPVSFVSEMLDPILERKVTA